MYKRWLLWTLDISMSFAVLFQQAIQNIRNESSAPNVNANRVAAEHAKFQTRHKASTY